MNPQYRSKYNTKIDLVFQDKGPNYVHAAMKIMGMFNVRSLNLSDNLLTDNHAKVISEMVGSVLPHLEQLFLNHNNFGPISGRYFKKAIHLNWTSKLSMMVLNNNWLMD
jgi:Ran GTPase-activating protein (RanGAP) involved in mRNA processing and transport